MLEDYCGCCSEYCADAGMEPDMPSGQRGHYDKKDYPAESVTQPKLGGTGKPPNKKYIATAVPGPSGKKKGAAAAYFNLNKIKEQLKTHQRPMFGLEKKLFRKLR